MEMHSNRTAAAIARAGTINRAVVLIAEAQRKLDQASALIEKVDVPIAHEAATIMVIVDKLRTKVDQL